jgi:hypothetical protein
MTFLNPSNIEGISAEIEANLIRKDRKFKFET